MNKRVLIYVRCSTSRDQNPEVQVEELRRFCNARAWTVVHEVVDAGFSGANTNRPGFKKFMKLARSRQIDVVAVVKLDRLFRSLKDMVLTIQELNELAVELVSTRDQLDFTTSTGRLMIHIVAAFAQFERDLISDRTKAGLDWAVKNGKRLGRPPIEKEVEQQVVELRAEGLTYWEIHKELGISKGTVYRILQADRKSSERTGPSSAFIKGSHHE